MYSKWVDTYHRILYGANANFPPRDGQIVECQRCPALFYTHDKMDGEGKWRSGVVRVGGGGGWNGWNSGRLRGRMERVAGEVVLEEGQVKWIGWDDRMG